MELLKRFNKNTYLEMCIMHLDTQRLNCLILNLSIQGASDGVHLSD